MSNKNYSKMYKPANVAAVEEEQLSFVPQDEVMTEDATPVMEAPEVTVAPAEPEVVEAIETKQVEKTVSAVVVNCAKLNVREEPTSNAKVIAVIDASSEVIICGQEGFGNYYKVCTASGVEGYCVKDFLELK